MDDPETLAAGNGWTRDKYLAMGQEYMKANPNLFFMQSLSGNTFTDFLRSYNTNIVLMKERGVEDDAP